MSSACRWMDQNINDIGCNICHAYIIGQVIARGLWYQKALCFNCRKYGHLKENCEQGNSKGNVFSKCKSKRRPWLPGVCQQCGKGCYWTNEHRSKRDNQGNCLPLVNDMGVGIAWGPAVKSMSGFPLFSQELTSRHFTTQSYRTTKYCRSNACYHRQCCARLGHR